MSVRHFIFVNKGKEQNVTDTSPGFIKALSKIPGAFIRRQDTQDELIYHEGKWYPHRPDEGKKYTICLHSFLFLVGTSFIFIFFIVSLQKDLATYNKRMEAAIKVCISDQISSFHLLFILLYLLSFLAISRIRSCECYP